MNLLTDVWVYWENKPGVSEIPAYIRLCHESIRKNSEGCTVHFLNEDNIHDYLGDLDPILDAITVSHLGEEYVSIAHKVDVLRAKLLHRYGGLYLDSDVIVFRPLVEILDRASGFDFACTRHVSTGENTVPNTILASKQAGKVISEYLSVLDVEVEKMKADHTPISWNEIGSDKLTPIVNRNDSSTWEIPEKYLLPVSWKEKRKFEADIPIGDVVSDECYAMALYHGAFGRKIHELSADELLGEHRLIGRAFNKALS